MRVDLLVDPRRLQAENWKVRLIFSESPVDLGWLFTFTYMKIPLESARGKITIRKIEKSAKIYKSQVDSGRLDQKNYKENG